MVNPPTRAPTMCGRVGGAEWVAQARNHAPSLSSAVQGHDTGDIWRCPAETNRPSFAWGKRVWELIGSSVLLGLCSSSLWF